MKKIGIYVLFLIVCISSYADQMINVKCVKVSDGDTITVLQWNKEYKVRLYGIDCPEKSQAYGKKAKQFTADKVFGKIVDVDIKDTDRYGRLVGIVHCELFSLNEELLKNGYAWHYKQYSKDSFYRRVFEDWEAEARRKKVGLWADLNPQAPWEYRKDKRE